MAHNQRSVPAVTASLDEECMCMDTHLQQAGTACSQTSIYTSFTSDTIHRGAGSSQNFHAEAQKQGGQ